MAAHTDEWRRVAWSRCIWLSHRSSYNYLSKHVPGALTTKISSQATCGREPRYLEHPWEGSSKPQMWKSFSKWLKKVSFNPRHRTATEKDLEKTERSFDCSRKTTRMFRVPVSEGAPMPLAVFALLSAEDWGRTNQGPETLKDWHTARCIKDLVHLHWRKRNYNVSDLERHNGHRSLKGSCLTSNAREMICNRHFRHSDASGRLWNSSSKFSSTEKWEIIVRKDCWSRRRLVAQGLVTDFLFQ